MALKGKIFGVVSTLILLTYSLQNRVPGEVANARRAGYSERNEAPRSKKICAPSGFSLTRSFSNAPVPEKQNAAFTAGKSNFRFIDRRKRTLHSTESVFYQLTELFEPTVIVVV